MNTRAIADAIAARFAGVTATLDGATESITFGPTALLPNQLAKGPALLVFPPSGELAVNMRRRADVLTFVVRLLRDPMSVPERTAWLYAWYDALRDRVEANMDLDLAYVAWAQVTNASLQLDGAEYAGVLYDEVALTVEVRLDEVIGTLAP